MARTLSSSIAMRRTIGWFGILTIVLFYVALYIVNYWLPLGSINYTSRIWNWSQTALTAGACLTLILQRRFLTTRAVLLGLVLATLSTLSHWLHNASLSWSLQEGVSVWACFLAGVILFKDQEAISVPAFQPPLANTGKSILFGAMVAVPFAVINNLYFYMNVGTVQLQNVFYSAFEALSPAIHEEIIFRFFLLAIALNLLKFSTSRGWAMVIAICLAVIPHSLNHLPELFRENPIMGLFMLIATSLLFGLPMAILQIKKNLETAMTFHWFIDFVRFLFGF